MVLKHSSQIEQVYGGVYTPIAYYLFEVFDAELIINLIYEIFVVLLCHPASFDDFATVPSEAITKNRMASSRIELPVKFLSVGSGPVLSIGSESDPECLESKEAESEDVDEKFHHLSRGIFGKLRN